MEHNGCICPRVPHPISSVPPRPSACLVSTASRDVARAKSSCSGHCVHLSKVGAGCEIMLSRFHGEGCGVCTKCMDVVRNPGSNCGAQWLLGTVGVHRLLRCGAFGHRPFDGTHPSLLFHPSLFLNGQGSA